MRSNADMHLLVTGASSGIGLALAELALARGHLVSTLSRSLKHAESLHATGGERVRCFTADVTDQASMHSAIAKAVAAFGPLDAVCANAGRGVDGELSELSGDDVLEVYRTNVVGVHHTLLASLPHLARGSRFVAVSSIAAYLPIPRMGAYCATKHALEAWAAAARMELRHRGIAVCTCNPGTVRTAFFDAAPKPGSVWSWRPGRALEAREVATAILKQCQRGGPRTRLIPWFARAAVALHHALPWVGERIMGGALERMRRDEG